MKHLLVSSLLICAFLSACAPRNTSSAFVAPFPRDEISDNDANLLNDFSGPDAVPTPPSRTSGTGTLPIQRVVLQIKPEPGKPGYGRSPHAPEAGLIDYRGKPPGTEIKDPYAEGKTLLVP